MITMTKRQKDAYDFIRSYIDEKGFGPSYDEIMKALGLNSKSGVHRIIHGLKERGVLSQRPYLARCIEIKQSYDAEYHLGRVLKVLDGFPISDHEAVKNAARYLARA